MEGFAGALESRLRAFSYQSLMPAAAGTPRCENGTWSLEVFGGGWCHPSPLDSRLRGNDELRGRNDDFGSGNHSFSYQLPMPAGAGTPRCENWVHWLMEGSVVVCATHAALSWGQAPALHFSLATVGCGCLGDGGWCRRPAPELIPDRSPGHAVVPITYRFTISASSLLLCSPTGAIGRLPVSLPGPPPLRRPLRR